MTEHINKDLFGNPIVDLKRNMADFFGVPPFSIINTVDGLWQARKKRWNDLIGDNGESREGTLMGDKKINDAEVLKKIKAINNGVSILDACLAECMVKWFSEEGHTVLDPFAGDSVFGFVASFFKRKFTGIELREEQAKLNHQRLVKHGLDGAYICDTSANMDKYIADKSMDFVFSCPPYADLEVYSDDPDDLSTMEYADFFETYSKILQNTYRKLKDNRFAVIVTSEVRDKKGCYIGLVPETIRAMCIAGYTYYNEIILVNAVGTLPLRAGRFMNSGRKIGRRHQNVLVFYKGNPDEIKNNYAEIIPKNINY